MIHLRAGDVAAARLELSRLPSFRKYNGRARLLDGYHRALLNRDSGSSRRSATTLLAVEETADRILDEQLAIAASQVALPLLGSSGLGHRAPDLEARLLTRAPHLGTRARAQVLTNMAWSRLLLREA
ncbi:unnamed protein product, partial [Laminaria digitata]